MQRSLSVQRMKAARQFWQEDRPAEAYQALQEILALDPGFAAAQGLLRRKTGSRADRNEASS